MTSKWTVAPLILAFVVLAGAQTGPGVVLETAPVVSKKLERTVALPADLSAYQSVAIYPKVSGFVDAIPVDRGSWVKAGDLIAALTAPEIEAQQLEAEARVQRIESQGAEAAAKLAALEAALAASQSTLAAAESNIAGAQSSLAAAQSNITGAQSTLAGAEAALTSLQATYDRLKKASETPGVVAGNDLDAAFRAAEVQRAVVGAQRAAVEGQRANLETLRSAADAQRSGADAQRAGIQAQQAGIVAQRAAIDTLRKEKAMAEAAVAQIKTTKAYLRVTAPFAGIVTERNAHPGSLAGPNPGSANPPLVRLDDILKLRLTVSVPESFVGSIATGVKVKFTVPAFPDEPFYGVIQRQAHTLDPKTRTMPVELDVDNARARLSPGMFASVTWPIARPGATFFVPPSAIVTTTERTFVIAVRNDTATWIDVRRGVSDGALMEVFGNLQPNDVVVRRGSDEIRQGQRIAVK
jgi:RND family efflux transporter MFP subunit